MRVRRHLRRASIAAPLLAAFAAAVAPAPASAEPDWQKVLRDCSDDGDLDRAYTRPALERALHDMPPDIATYTNCRAVIRTALSRDWAEYQGRRHHHHHRHHHDQPTTMQPRATGVAPATAAQYTAAGPSPSGHGALLAIDGDAATAWSTDASGRGLMVSPSAGNYRALAVVTDTPGWTLEIYWSNAAEPGGPLSGDWSQAAFVNPASRRSKWKVPDAKHYLVWVADAAGGRVRVNEIQLFPG
jgi:hypothetical protein